MRTWRRIYTLNVIYEGTFFCSGYLQQSLKPKEVITQAGKLGFLCSVMFLNSCNDINCPEILIITTIVACSFTTCNKQNIAVKNNPIQCL